MIDEKEFQMTGFRSGMSQGFFYFQRMWRQCLHGAIPLCLLWTSGIVAQGPSSRALEHPKQMGMESVAQITGPSGEVVLAGSTITVDDANSSIPMKWFSLFR